MAAVDKSNDEINKARNKVNELNVLKNYLTSKINTPQPNTNHLLNMQSKVIAELNKQQEELKQLILKKNAELKAQRDAISLKETDINERILRSEAQQTEIEYKKQILETRNRMLQLSQEKNLYKKKMIYTLLAVIIFILLIIISSYTFYVRRMYPNF